MKISRQKRARPESATRVAISDSGTCGASAFIRSPAWERPCVVSSPPPSPPPRTRLVTLYPDGREAQMAVLHPGAAPGIALDGRSVSLDCGGGFSRRDQEERGWRLPGHRTGRQTTVR